MRFRLATTGAGGNPLQSGVGNFFNAIAMAPMYQAQAAEEAQTLGMRRQLMQSQIGENLAKAAIAQQEEKLLAGRGDVLNLMGASRAGMSVPEFQAGVSERTNGAPAVGPSVLHGRERAFDDAITTLYGPAAATPADKVNWEQLAKGRGHYQQQDVLDQVLNGRINPATAGRAVAASEGKKLVDNIGNTGVGYDQFSGQGVTIDPGLRALFGEEGAALVQQRKAAAGASGAQANLSNARRDRVVGGYDKPVTILGEDDEATITRMPTGGEPVSVGVAPRKSTGTDATNAKERNRVTSAVEKEMPGASDEEISAEVERRLSRRGIKPTGKAPAAPAPVSALTAPPAMKDRKAGQVYQTPKGAMKWTGTGWLPAN